MDDAISIKKSPIEFCLYLLWICLASFWMIVADAGLMAKLSASFCILFCVIVVGYRNRKARNIIGNFSLTEAGLVPAESAYASYSYTASLHQVLPWCLHLKLRIDKNRFETLIWRDALSHDDWRKLSRYLPEKDNETRIDHG
jgi:hypothetical protein